MEIQFFGAARTVTGSMHHLTVNHQRMLLDCGLYQGKRLESYERNMHFPFDPSSIKAVILSHAHIDHSGNLPNVVKQGFRGPIYSTPATRDLCNLMLYDSAYIQEKDMEHLNKKHLKDHAPAVQPLYSAEDVTETMKRFVSVSYGRPLEVSEGCVVEFRDAGHILGSAVTACEIDENHRTMRLGFTGDLGRKSTPILKDPDSLSDIDVESTYGGKVHEPTSNMQDSLSAVAMRTIDRGGKIIIPAFSVGRTQELLYVLFELFEEHRLPQIPVFVDSPLAVNATEVFRLHPECFDHETLDHLHAYEDPFGFDRLKYVRTVEESKKLNSLKEPCVIIAASGMCEAGRILHHLANNIENPRNTILIVGFQAEHTLGRRIVEKQPEVKIFGNMYKLKAEVSILNSFSAHAGQDELVDYVKNLRQDRLKEIFLVHGEFNQADQLRLKLGEQGYHSVRIPERTEKAEFLA
ncbi:MAG: RNA-metabolising metallo-beta-lactamase [Bacteroidetes bacterium]|nr:RNA-metabolising metallo-beta-lactamase [Bacteroidota bacterium]